MTEAARAAVRAVSERTEGRIGSLYGAFDRKVGAALAALEVEAGTIAAARDLSPEERALVERAVAKVAAELTGSVE